jgi:hypothetical protein
MAADNNNNNNNNNTNNNTIATINWYDIINQDTRSIDDADLGKVKGLYEPLIVIEKGTIIKKNSIFQNLLLKNIQPIFCTSV